MARKFLLMTVAIMALSVFALAATKPNFSGTWTMDRARTYGLPGNMTQILTITHKEDQIDFEDRKSTRLNSSHVVTSRMPSSA